MTITMDGTVLATRANGALSHEDPPMFTAEQIDLITRTCAAGATKDELSLFLYQAQRTGLDPLARQIHFVKRGGKGAIQVGIDGYRLIADRTGKYAGNDDPIFEGGNPPASATVTVWKLVSGVRCPFTATARWSEYVPGEQQAFMWRKMPYLMLGKTAEALALRKAFPAELSGVYTDTEMDQAGPADAPKVQRFDAQPVDEATLRSASLRESPPRQESTSDSDASLEGLDTSGPPTQWPDTDDAEPDAPSPVPNRQGQPAATPKQLETIARMARAAGKSVDTDGLTRAQASDVISALIGVMGERRAS